MEYRQAFLGSNISAILLLLSMAFIFFGGLTTGIIIFLVGGILGIITVSNVRRIDTSDLFLVLTTVLGLFLVIYFVLEGVRRDLALLGLILYIVTFFMTLSRKQHRISSKRREFKMTPYEVDKDSAINVEAQKIYDDLENIKKELKVMHDVEEQSTDDKKKYYYKESGKSFHLAGCISLARTPKAEIKSSKSRTELLANGYKSCKICNS